MPRRAVGEIIHLCHQHRVLVSTGGFLEQVLMQGKEAVKSYIQECKELEFDIFEISSGFITMPADDWLRLVEHVQKAGLKAKPEVGVRFRAGGATRLKIWRQKGPATQNGLSGWRSDSWTPGLRDHD